MTTQCNPAAKSDLIAIDRFSPQCDPDEIELNEIVSADINLPKDDACSGIFSLPNDQIAIDGTVHNEIVIDEEMSVFDIYIQNGADFLAVSSDELPQQPLVGTRIRIVGKGLQVFPTFT